MAGWHRQAPVSVLYKVVDGVSCDAAAVFSGSYVIQSLVVELVEAAALGSWCFEPSQPQRITSGLIEAAA